MPYASNKQRRFMHAQHPDIAKRWDKEMRGKKKYKISSANLKGSFGEMNPDTNEIKIDIKAHKKKGKLDIPELASTIKHEIMHVEKPHATEKEVYKATAKTKIPFAEQQRLISKIRHKQINYKFGAIKRKLKMKGKAKPGDLITRFNETNPKTHTAIMGLV